MAYAERRDQTRSLAYRTWFSISVHSKSFTKYDWTQYWIFVSFCVCKICNTDNKMNNAHIFWNDRQSGLARWMEETLCNSRMDLHIIDANALHQPWPIMHSPRQITLPIVFPTLKASLHISFLCSNWSILLYCKLGCAWIFSVDFQGNPTMYSTQSHNSRRFHDLTQPPRAPREYSETSI